MTHFEFYHSKNETFKRVFTMFCDPHYNDFRTCLSPHKIVLRPLAVAPESPTPHPTSWATIGQLAASVGFARSGYRILELFILCKWHFCCCCCSLFCFQGSPMLPHVSYEYFYISLRLYNILLYGYTTCYLPISQHLIIFLSFSFPFLFFF